MNTLGKIKEAKKFNHTSLDLSYNNIDVLPSDIGSLNNLKALYLANNNLKELPLELFNLINLRTLDLSDNKLTKLSSKLGNLINLENLNLSNNNLSTLPNKIGNLIKLKNLNLYNNKLTILPSEIINLINLTNFYFMYKKYRKVTTVITAVITTLTTLLFGGFILGETDDYMKESSSKIIESSLGLLSLFTSSILGSILFCTTLLKTPLNILVYVLAIFLIFSAIGVIKFISFGKKRSILVDISGTYFEMYKYSKTKRILSLILSSLFISGAIFIITVKIIKNILLSF